MVGLNPLPYLVAEAMMSNIGGIATLVGDPPNIMISSAAGIDFNRFLLHMAPTVAVIWCSTIALLLFRFRTELTPPDSFTGVVDLDERRAITDPRGLKRGLIGLAVVIALFFVHHHLHLYPSYATFIGLALVLLLSQPEPDSLLKNVDWPVLMFFAALFVIVGGVQGSGLLALIGQHLASVASDPELLLISCLLLMWIAALLSAIIDNIPFTVTMIPIVLSLEAQGVNMLLNESVLLERGGQHIALAGIDDAHYFRVNNMEKAAQNIPEGMCSILLSHTPEIYRQAVHAEFDVMLTGHTHGGQICLPGGIPLTLDSKCPRYMGSGQWRYRDMIGYTSVGAGTSIVNVRLNCPPEVTLHRLHAGG